MIRFPWRKNAGPGALKKVQAHEAAAEFDTNRIDSVRGERGAFMTSGPRSLQARMSSLLAAALMTSVGAGLLAWYYTHALSHVNVKPVAMRALEGPGQNVTLPALSAFTQPPAARSGAVVADTSPTRTVAEPHSAASAQSSPVLSASSLPELPLLRATGGYRGPYGYGVPPRSALRQQRLDRRFSGVVFAGENHSSESLAGRSAAEPAASVLTTAWPGNAPASSQTTGELASLLRPSVIKATEAQVLPTLRLLLPKGTFIDCTLETAIDSTLPGMTTCITATDTFGGDGTVVLLERGTRLIGETRGELRQGQARVFVVWTEARTPEGVVAQLDSPGTDALGRSGLEGRVNRHFWQRFGAAALVSTIDGAVQSEAQSPSRGGAVVLDPAASDDVLTEILRSTVNIPPTVRVRNGARIQVLVARDVDFRSVYDLDPR